MILHLVNKPPGASPALRDCVALTRAGDALLLLEDGVYAAVTGMASAAALIGQLEDLRLYALEEDVQARGLTRRLSDKVQLVDYAGFVALTVEYTRIQSWY